MDNVDRTFNNSFPNCRMLFCCFLSYAGRKYHVFVLDSEFQSCLWIKFYGYERPLKDIHTHFHYHTIAIDHPDF